MSFVVFYFLYNRQIDYVVQGKKQQRAHLLNNKIGDSISVMALKFKPIILLLIPSNLL